MMTIEDILTNLESLQKDYQDFYNEIWQDPEHYSIIAESLRGAIDIVFKYKMIEEIMNADLEHIHPLDRDKYIVASIKEVIDNVDQT